MEEKKDFVTSYFSWVEPTEQKKIEKKLEEVTKDKAKKRKK